jgi:hypothetical protein
MIVLPKKCSSYTVLSRNDRKMNPSSEIEEEKVVSEFQNNSFYFLNYRDSYF